MSKNRDYRLFLEDILISIQKKNRSFDIESDK